MIRKTIKEWVGRSIHPSIDRSIENPEAARDNKQSRHPEIYVVVG